MVVDPLGNSAQDLLSFLETVFTFFANLCNFIVSHSVKFTLNYKQVHKANPKISRRSVNRGNSAAIRETKSLGNVLGKIANTLAFTALAIDIGLTWRDNYRSESPSWATDSIVDTVYIGAKFAINYGIMAACSLIPIPVIGPLIGLGLSIGLNYLIDWIVGETGILNTVKTWAADVGESIKNGWDYFWSFAWV